MGMSGIAVLLACCACSCSSSAGSAYVAGFIPGTKSYFKKRFKIDRLREATENFVAAEKVAIQKKQDVVNENRADEYYSDGNQERVNDQIKELNQKIPMFTWCETTMDDLRAFRYESDKNNALAESVISTAGIDATYTGEDICKQAAEKKSMYNAVKNDPAFTSSMYVLDAWEVPEDYEDDGMMGLWNMVHGKAPGATCDASVPPVNGRVGDCTDQLQSGSSCQPTCNDGFEVTGATLCADGILSSASCLDVADEDEDAEEPLPEAEEDTDGLAAVDDTDPVDDVQVKKKKPKKKKSKKKKENIEA